MGKNIDLSQISEDDVEYLLQRPWLAAQAEHEGFAVPDRFYIESGKSVPQYVGLVESTESEEVVNGVPLGEDPEDPEDEPEEDEPEEDDRTYQEWSVDELKAELVQRELSKEGRKQELIDRLEADDLEDEEDDEDDTEG